jgi:hypothetical protein
MVLDLAPVDLVSTLHIRIVTRGISPGNCGPELAGCTAEEAVPAVLLLPRQEGLLIFIISNLGSSRRCWVAWLAATFSFYLSIWNLACFTFPPDLCICISHIQICLL